MNYNTLDINKFNINCLVQTNNFDKKIFIYGKHNSGKSWLIRDIMFKLRSLEKGIVMTNKLDVEFYNSFIPSKFVSDKYNKNKIISLMRNKCRKYIIFDDCRYTTNITGDNSLFVESTSNITDIKKKYYDYIFLFKEDLTTNKKKIWKAFGTIFPDFDIFNQVFNTITSGNDCMVIRNTDKPESFYKQVFWYKAEERYDFMVGVKNYQPDHYRPYDEYSYFEEYINKCKKNINYDVNDEDMMIFHVLNS